MTPCTNASCPIWMICQNKEKHCPGNAVHSKSVRNGYAVMACQEQSMRNSAIDYSGDWSV